MSDIPFRRNLHRVWSSLWDHLPGQFLPLRRSLARLGRQVFGTSLSGGCGPFNQQNYAAWLSRYALLKANDRHTIRSHVATLPPWPLISIVMPVTGTPLPQLRTAMRTVQAQLWPHWELCLSLGAAEPAELRQSLAQEAARDTRIRLAHLAPTDTLTPAEAATALAHGDFVTLMAPDARLSEEALYEVAMAAITRPETAIIYTDEDHVDADERRYNAWLKPGFDADLLLGQDLLGSLAVYRHDLLLRLGGLRDATPSARHDLALRATAEVGGERILHIPAILYHGRPPPAQNPPAHRKAIAQALATAGTAARVEPAPLAPDWSRIVWPLPSPPPLVSVIVPTRDHTALLGLCADGVLQRTDYPAIEFIVVDNGSKEARTHALFGRLRADPRVRILTEPGRFNYSALNNRAVREAHGEVLVLLNNDIEVMEAGWLREMVSHAVRCDVGAVGAKLYFSDGTLQHGGIVTGAGGVAGHYLSRAARGDPGYFGSLALVRQVTAVTGACLALRRSVYQQVGGMDEKNLAVAFNDVDLCLRIRQAGYRIVWTPFAELYHLESASRGPDMSPGKALRFAREVAFMKYKWGKLLAHDPFYSPLLSLDSAHVALARQPRRTPPFRGRSALSPAFALAEAPFGPLAPARTTPSDPASLPGPHLAEEPRRTLPAARPMHHHHDKTMTGSI